MEDKLEVGDVIQIDPETEVNPLFGGKLAIVDEVKGWGCIAYVDTFRGRAYIRLSTEQFRYIGKAVWVVDMSQEGE